MDFVDEVYLSVAFSKLIFGVDKYQTMLCGDFRAALEELAGVLFHLLVVGFVDDALGDDFLARDVFIVSGLGFCGRGDDWFGEFLVLLHPVGEAYAAYLAASCLIVTPCATGEVAADNHLHAESSHLSPTVTIGSGVASFQLGTMSAVASRNFAAIWLSTCPLKGMPLGRITSNADMRSVATITMMSSLMSYTSRTLPWYTLFWPGKLKSVLVSVVPLLL